MFESELHKIKKNKTEYTINAQNGQCNSTSENDEERFENEYINNPEYKKTLSSFVNIKDNNGQTALHLASMCGNCLAMKLLIKYNGSAFIKDEFKKVLLI